MRSKLKKKMKTKIRKLRCVRNEIIVFVIVLSNHLPKQFKNVSFTVWLMIYYLETTFRTYEVNI